MEFECDFHKYIRARGLQKQEGVLFRHVLRFILLLEEMASIPPAETTIETWEDRLDDWIDRLTQCCRAVDPECTDEVWKARVGLTICFWARSPNAAK